MKSLGILIKIHHNVSKQNQVIINKKLNYHQKHWKISATQNF